MQILIITIDDNVARGLRRDTNGDVIARALASLGLQAKERVIIGNDREALRDVVASIGSDFDVVVSSGGIGPAIHDRALEAVLDGLLEEQQVFEELSHSLIDTSGKSMTLGSAQAFLLPSSPAAMEALLELHLIPALTSAGQKSSGIQHVLRISGLDESEVSEKLSQLAFDAVDVSLSHDGPELELRLTSTDSASTAERAKEEIQRAGALICRTLGRNVHGPLGQDLASATQEALRALERTVATVEIGTGSGLAELLTESVSDGSSDQGLLLGLVSTCLTPIAKAVEISSNKINDSNLISEDSSGELALAIKRATGADYGVALVGSLGPHRGPGETPVGLVCFAVADRDDAIRHETRRLRAMSRHTMRQWSAASALRLLLDVCREEGG